MRKRIIGIVAGVVIALAGVEEVSAANGWEIPLNAPGPVTSQTNSSVSLSLSSGTIQTDLDAANAATNPDEAGKVLSQTATITVGNTDGYTIYVSGNTNLLGRNNSSHKIPSITSSKTLGSMSNEWGYYGVLGDSEASWNPSTSFKAMTTSQQSVGTGGATSGSVMKKLTLFYGARVTSSAAEDFYGNTVTLSVVAQPRTVTTTVTKFNGITTMQEMTSTICKNAAENDTARLRDTRDGKYYWVTKLLDGNCWMSQNLDLDIVTSGSWTEMKSNVEVSTSDIVASDVRNATSWGGGAGYPPNATYNNSNSGSISAGSTSNMGTYSWDLGDFILNTPSETATCGTNSTGLAACSSRGFVNTAGWTASADPNFYRATSYKGADGITDCTKAANSAANSDAREACKIYDAHYIVGNYYQWNAATAGTGAYASTGGASGSICPKNWRLPVDNDGEKNGFTFLLQQYGVRHAVVGTSDKDQKTYNIALSPLFFVRAGYINPYVQQLVDAGRQGYNWLSQRLSSTDTDYANLLDFRDSAVYTFSNNARCLGVAVRCLVPTV